MRRLPVTVRALLWFQGFKCRHLYGYSRTLDYAWGLNNIIGDRADMWLSSYTTYRHHEALSSLHSRPHTCVCADCRRFREAP